MSASASAGPQQQRTRLGFFDGVGAFFSGLGFIVSKPGTWGWALIPTLIATIIFFGLGGLAIWGGMELSHRVLGLDPQSVDTASAGTTAGVWALRALFWLVGIVLSFLLSISFAQPLSGFALDRIAQKQELALGGRTWPDQPFFASAFRALRVTFLALAMSLPFLALLTAITFLFPPASVITFPLKFIVTGLAVAYDFLDYPLGLRGAGARSRLGFIRENFAAVLGFGAAAALLLLIPFVGLLLLPFGVAGATRLVVKSER